MSEEGVTVISGRESNLPSRSESPSGKKTEEGRPKKFQNGWTKEQEKLMADWSDIASCYRWLHDQSEKVFHMKNLLVNIPVIILSTLGGTANFAAQSLFEDDENGKKYASFAIGGISIFAGMLTTIGNYLRYAQLEESHRVAGITWGKFQRLLAVELALNPNDRMDSLDFLKICRAELDRLIEQSPATPTKIVREFEKKFGKMEEIEKPEICGDIDHTKIYRDNEGNTVFSGDVIINKTQQSFNGEDLLFDVNFVNTSTMTFNGIWLSSPAGLPATNVDNFSFFANGNFIEKSAIVSFTTDGISTSTLVINPSLLGYGFDSGDLVLGIGKFA
jgi:hypothetical protein